MVRMMRFDNYILWSFSIKKFMLTARLFQKENKKNDYCDLLVSNNILFGHSIEITS